MTSDSIVLTNTQQDELSRIAQSRSLPAGYVFRARLILMSAEGASQYDSAESEDNRSDHHPLEAAFPRFRHGRARYQPSRAAGLDPYSELRARILSATRRRPQDGSTHWSCRKLAAELGVSKDAVHRVWKEAGLKPHRLERYMASDDPDFESKAADIIGLYLNPPEHAAVFCVDEKTAIQALDRLNPVLPLSPGRAERHGFEYYRHGTLSLYVALNVKTGVVEGKTARRHTSAEFIAFLTELIAKAKWAREIHIVLDNLSAHKTEAVERFLADRPKVRFHFTPTYSSWLNQVEMWFAKIERDVIARGLFTSIADLRRKLMRYVRAYAQRARPFRWTYTDPKRRIITKRITGTGH